MRVDTIILAGGQGTRLQPLTTYHSKPAVSYGGRYRLIDIPISNSINSDFRQIYVITQYLSEELNHHISQTYRFDSQNPGSLEILSPQKDLNGELQLYAGTADAVRKNLPSILKSPADYFLILSGDQLYNINFQEIIRFAKTKNAELTIASLPVSEKEAPRMGLLNIDAQNKVIDFIEKPQEPQILRNFELPNRFFENVHITPPSRPCYLGSMGIYVFAREALCSLLLSDQRNDFGYHLITTAVKRGNTAAYVFNGYWEDIGTVASYYEANLCLARSGKGLNIYDQKNPIYARSTFLPGPKIKSAKIYQSIICEGCIIEADEISNSVIGFRSHIKQGSIIRDTIMMGNHFLDETESNYWIGENCHIEKTIIDERVQIGDRVKITNKNKHITFDGEGIFVRDGITIITAGTKIPNGYEF
jgi:glucose-1-phosphate adenylyltransferase